MSTSTITDIPAVEEDAATVAMRILTAGMRRSLQADAGEHQALFASIWRSDRYTAAQAFAALGTRAVAVMQVGALNVQRIGAMAASFGQTLADYLPESDYVPPLPYTEHEDGTVTIDV